MKKRIFTVLLAVCMVLALGTVTAWADGSEPDTGWYNNAQNSFTLYDAADLLGLAKLVNEGTDSFEGKTIYLGNNIDISDIEWEPIGITTSTGRESPTYTDHSFKGTFDGQGHTISGLKMTSSDTDKPYYNSFNTGIDSEKKNGYACYGFFGGVNGGTVKNVTFTDVNISEPNDTSEDNNNNNTVAAAVGAAINGATLENITVSGTVTGVSRAAGVVGYVGGFSAENSAFDTGASANSMGTITIRNCVNHATVKSENTSDTQGYASASGICATVNQSGATSGTVSFVGNTNDGAITGHPCAGILATAWSNSDGSGLTMNLTGNTNRGAIKETTTATEKTASNAYAAGIAVLNSRTKINCTLDGNKNYGAVTSEYGNAAGIIRAQKVNTENSGLTIQFGSSGNSNYGDVTGKAYAGGIMDGEPNANTVLEHLTNTGTIKTTATSGTSYAGGIVASMNSGTLDGSSCTNTGTVNAGGNVVSGSLVGQVEGSVTLKNISDDAAIGRIIISAHTERTMTLENVDIETLSVVSSGNATGSGTSTFVLTGSSIGTMDVSGHFSNGINMEISGGEVDSISVHDLTGASDGMYLSLKVDGNAEIGTFKVNHQNNKLGNLYVTTTAGSSIDTIDVDCGIQKAAVHIGKLSAEDTSNANAGQITTVRTDGTTVDILATSVASPQNVLYVTDALATDETAKNILSGDNTDEATKNFTGVVLAANEQLNSPDSLRIASGKELIIEENVTLTINDRATINSYGTITNYGTISGGTISGGTVANYGTVSSTTTDSTTVTNYYIVTFKDNDTVFFTVDVAENMPVNKPADPTRPGYRFIGWYLDGKPYDFSTPVTGPITLVAQWKEIEPVVPDPHAITITQPANGTVSTSLSNASKGAVITVTAKPNAGYELAYITVNGEKITGNTFVMPDEAVTVSAVFVTSSFPFTDVTTGAWYYDAVNYVYTNGLMDGVSDTTFNPDGSMTRAMVWAILARLDGQTVTGANWATVARNWAVHEGVSDGENANGLVTREQLATMIWRYVGEPKSTYSLSAFTDAGSVSDWASTAMAWAVEHGIITGVTATTLVPQGTATRAQCAAILMRFNTEIA